jgi:hypothetical protein
MLRVQKALPEILVPKPQVQAKVACYATAKRDITDKASEWPE